MLLIQDGDIQIKFPVKTGFLWLKGHFLGQVPLPPVAGCVTYPFQTTGNTA